MNYTPTFGWYYRSANQKAPAWTGVEYLYNFLLRGAASAGPRAVECAIGELRAGDLVQLSFSGASFQHSPIVVQVSASPRPRDILVAAHSYDADYRPLSTYEYAKLRCLHILDAAVL